MGKKTFMAPNISCDHCVNTIQIEIGEMDGVSSVTADAASKMVSIEWNDPQTWESIRALMTEIGFPPGE